jgi:mRNA degradation ribonuclease J1/J2
MKEPDPFDSVMDDHEDDYRRKRNRVDQEELDSHKVPADEAGLVPVGSTKRSGAEIRLPAVRPATDSRQSKKLANAEQERQVRMAQTTQRTVLAQNSMVAVAVHAQRQLDLAQEIMIDCLYGVKRRPAMNEFMNQVTSRCLSLAESGVMAILESHPKRIAEDL